VSINNIRIYLMCNKQRAVNDVIIAPVISPYELIKEEVRQLLESNFHLIYLKTKISSLKNRDPKRLYVADRGEIDDLIGCSKCNSYNKPQNPELIVSKIDGVPTKQSQEGIFNCINTTVFVGKFNI